MDNSGEGQNTAIEVQMLGKKTKIPAKHIKQIKNKRVNNIIKDKILLKTKQIRPKKMYILST